LNDEVHAMRSRCPKHGAALSINDAAQTTFQAKDSNGIQIGLVGLVVVISYPYLAESPRTTVLFQHYFALPISLVVGISANARVSNPIL
jgi:hypothetical protein